MVASRCDLRAPQRLGEEERLVRLDPGEENAKDDHEDSDNSVLGRSRRCTQGPFPGCEVETSAPYPGQKEDHANDDEEGREDESDPCIHRTPGELELPQRAQLTGPVVPT